MESESKEKKSFNFLDETEIAKFTPAEVRTYEDSLKAYRDLKNSIDIAREEGIIEGEIKGEIKGKFEGKIEIAKNLKNKGFKIADIVEITGLSTKEVEKM